MEVIVVLGVLGLAVSDIRVLRRNPHPMPGILLYTVLTLMGAVLFLLSAYHDFYLMPWIYEGLGIPL